MYEGLCKREKEMDIDLVLGIVGLETGMSRWGLELQS